MKTTKREEGEEKQTDRQGEGENKQQIKEGGCEELTEKQVDSFFSSEWPILRNGGAGSEGVLSKG